MYYPDSPLNKLFRSLMYSPWLVVAAYKSWFAVYHSLSRLVKGIGPTTNLIAMEVLDDMGVKDPSRHKIFYWMLRGVSFIIIVWGFWIAAEIIAYVLGIK